MSTGCEFFEDALADRAAGRTGGDAARRLDGHLAECEDCRAALAVMRAVRASAPAPPPGLESRIRSAVRQGGAGAGAERSPGASPSSPGPFPSAGASPVRGPGRRWPRPVWAVPLAAAAALALLWLVPGPEAGPVDGGAGEVDAPAVVWEELEAAPYGALPAEDGVVAGEPLLAELSVEELERLLEEMET